MAGAFNLRQRPRLKKLKRHAAHCYYCRKPINRMNKTLDHKIPRSRGGRNHHKNIVICCKECNQKKKDMTVAEFSVFLENEKGE